MINYVGVEFAKDHGYSINYTAGSVASYTKEGLSLDVRQDEAGHLEGRLSIVWWLYRLTSDWISLPGNFDLFESKLIDAERKLNY